MEGETMAFNHSIGSCSPSLLKTILCILALCLGGYIVGPPLYWHTMEGLAAVNRPSSYISCPNCNCDCSSEPILSIPLGLINTSFTDCVKRDPEVTKESEKKLSNLFTEEVHSKETEALESQKRADMALLEAKKISSQYQKEADKCNSGMETCEEAREKAETVLVGQKKLSAMWELRARQKGWKERGAKSRA